MFFPFIFSQLLFEKVTCGEQRTVPSTIKIESEKNIVINVDPGNEVKINIIVSKTIHPGQTESPMYTQYSEGATRIASSVNGKLSMLAPDPLNYGTVCIYRVPEKHRKKNQEAYTPRLVSIGPLHHGESQLQAMEENKLKYLNNFLHTFGVPLELLAECMQSQEKLVRGFYEDNCFQKLPDLLGVVLLDGVFIVELFLKNYFPEMRESGDTIFENSWVSNDILHDLLLLENQLPMRFVCTMYNDFAHRKLGKFLDNDSIDPPSFHELARKYFKNVGNTYKLELPPGCLRVRHLVEFLAILHSPQSPRDEPGQGKSSKFAPCANASKLLAAGVKFTRRGDKCLFNVCFDKVKGELEIPQLTINEYTETLFRNLIAFEQYEYSARYITSYVILMDNLIDTAKDVDILVKHKIIRNFLGSGEQVAHVFNNLYNEIVTDPKEFYFASLCIELDEYSRDLWHKGKSKLSKWFAMLRRDYFSSPWSIMSVIAAVILLVLTVIQTVCSLLQV